MRDVFSWKFIIQTVFNALTVYIQFSITMLVDIVPEFSWNRLGGPQAIKSLWAFQTPLNSLIHTLRLMLKFKTIGITELRTELRQYYAIEVETTRKGLQVIPETVTNSDNILNENLGISSDTILYNNLGISLPRQCTSVVLRTFYFATTWELNLRLYFERTSELPLTLIFATTWALLRTLYFATTLELHLTLYLARTWELPRKL